MPPPKQRFKPLKTVNEAQQEAPLSHTGQRSRQTQQIKAKITPQQSVESVWQFVQMSVGTICYERGMFPETCFDDQPLCLEQTGGEDEATQQSQQLSQPTKLTMKLIKKGFTPQADALNEVLNAAISDALSKQFLASLSVVLFLDEDKLHEVIETYTFTFFYSRAGQVGMNLGTSIGSEASASFSSGIDPNMTRKEVGESMKRAFHKIFSACRNLDNLPPHFNIDVKLLYTEKCPDDYQPPGFKSTTGQHLIMGTYGIDQVPEVFRSSAAVSGHHGVALSIMSCVNYIPTAVLKPGTTDHEALDPCVAWDADVLAFDRDKIDTGITNPHRKIDPSRYYEPNMALQPRGLLNEEGGTERIPVNAHVSRLPSHKKDERILERHDILGGSQLLARHDLAQKRRVRQWSQIPLTQEDETLTLTPGVRPLNDSTCTTRIRPTILEPEEDGPSSPHRFHPTPNRKRSSEELEGAADIEDTSRPNRQRTKKKTSRLQTVTPPDPIGPHLPITGENQQGGPSTNHSGDRAVTTGGERAKAPRKKPTPCQRSHTVKPRASSSRAPGKSSSTRQVAVLKPEEIQATALKSKTKASNKIGDSTPLLTPKKTVSHSKESSSQAPAVAVLKNAAVKKVRSAPAAKGSRAQQEPQPSAREAYGRSQKGHWTCVCGINDRPNVYPDSGVRCDGCGSWLHGYCLGGLERGVFAGEWYCAACSYTACHEGEPVGADLRGELRTLAMIRRALIEARANRGWLITDLTLQSLGCDKAEAQDIEVRLQREGFIEKMDRVDPDIRQWICGSPTEASYRAYFTIGVKERELLRLPPAEGTEGDSATVFQELPTSSLGSQENTPSTEDGSKVFKPAHARCKSSRLVTHIKI